MKLNLIFFLFTISMFSVMGQDSSTGGNQLLRDEFAKKEAWERSLNMLLAPWNADLAALKDTYSSEIDDGARGRELAQINQMSDTITELERIASSYHAAGYSDDYIQQLFGMVRDHKISIGMPEWLVYLSLGNPSKTSTFTDASGTTKCLTYGTSLVNIDSKGLVSAISEEN